jgi:hypothetical protein
MYSYAHLAFWFTWHSGISTATFCGDVGSAGAQYSASSDPFFFFWTNLGMWSTDTSGLTVTTARAVEAERHVGGSGLGGIGLLQRRLATRQMPDLRGLGLL